MRNDSHNTCWPFNCFARALRSSYDTHWPICSTNTQDEWNRNSKKIETNRKRIRFLYFPMPKLFFIVLRVIDFLLFLIKTIKNGHTRMSEKQKTIKFVRNLKAFFLFSFYFLIYHFFCLLLFCKHL